MICIDCGGNAKYYDSVTRRILLKDRKVTYISVKRYKCLTCGKIHRETAGQLRFKQYDKKLIFECINNRDRDFVYPADITIHRWTQSVQPL